MFLKPPSAIHFPLCDQPINVNISMELPPNVDPSKTRLLPDPDGSEPDLIHPPSLRGATWSVLTILLVLMYTIAILRLGTNLKLYKKLALDDCESVIISGYAR
jgi:hypothetical protein